MRLIAIAAALFALAACSEKEPESVENRAEALEAELENRANQLEAEAENGVDAASNELETDFPALANDSANVMGNEAAGD